MIKRTITMLKGLSEMMGITKKIMRISEIEMN